MDITQSLAEEWITILSRNVEATPQLYTYEASEDQLILCAQFTDRPEPALRTFFTLGISSDTETSKELQLTIAGPSEEWAEALFEFADILKSQKVEPVSGGLFHMHAPLMPGISLDSWVVGLVKSTVSLPSHERSVAYYSCFPISAEEFELLNQIGLLKFLQALGTQCYNPNRHIRKNPDNVA